MLENPDDLTDVIKKIFENNLVEEFLDIFNIKHEFLKSKEICGICLNEYDDEMISFCQKHFICFLCFNEMKSDYCINKCYKIGFILYKKNIKKT